MPDHLSPRTTAPTDPAPLHIAVITGSTRDGRFGPRVSEWIADHVRARPDMSLDVVDLVATPLPTVLPDFGTPPPPEAIALLADVSPRLTVADAFVIVTPEYNHSYPASLKNAVDWHGPEWQAKPVGFVSYGGLSGGLRAVEHLRPVLAELHAVTIRDTVSFHNVWGSFGEGGSVDPAAEAAAKGFLDQLAWWGRALRDAKSVHPYVA